VDETVDGIIKSDLLLVSHVHLDPQIRTYFINFFINCLFNEFIKGAGPFSL
jgi:hypothetical protein